MGKRIGALGHVEVKVGNRSFFIFLGIISFLLFTHQELLSRSIDDGVPSTYKKVQPMLIGLPMLNTTDSSQIHVSPAERQAHTCLDQDYRCAETKQEAKVKVSKDIIKATLMTIRLIIGSYLVKTHPHQKHTFESKDPWPACALVSSTRGELTEAELAELDPQAVLMYSLDFGASDSANSTGSKLSPRSSAAPDDGATERALLTFFTSQDLLTCARADKTCGACHPFGGKSTAVVDYPVNQVHPHFVTRNSYTHFGDEDNQSPMDVATHTILMRCWNQEMSTQTGSTLMPAPVLLKNLVGRMSMFYVNELRGGWAQRVKQRNKAPNQGVYVSKEEFDERAAEEAAALAKKMEWAHGGGWAQRGKKKQLERMQVQAEVAPTAPASTKFREYVKDKKAPVPEAVEHKGWVAKNRYRAGLLGPGSGTNHPGVAPLPQSHAGQNDRRRLQGVVGGMKARRKHSHLQNVYEAARASGHRRWRASTEVHAHSSDYTAMLAALASCSKVDVFGFPQGMYRGRSPFEAVLFEAVREAAAGVSNDVPLLADLLPGELVFHESEEAPEDPAAPEEEDL